MEIEIKSIHNFIQMILSNFLEKFALQKKKPKNLLKKIKKFDKIFLWQIQYLKFSIIRCFISIFSKNTLIIK